jgi:fumarate hydratase subunit beta
MTVITLPDDLKKLSALPAGTIVRLRGEVFTLRDKAHAHLVALIKKNKTLPVALRNAALYYCGPTQPKKGFPAGACGPTTSKRMDPYTPQLLARGVKVMIGKGKRSEAVIKAARKHRAVYLVTLGGLGAYLASKVISSVPIAYAQWGPEAIYKLRIEDFPAIVAVDSRGKSIY